jgi:hypothetical protein
MHTQTFSKDWLLVVLESVALDLDLMEFLNPMWAGLGSADLGR